MSEQSQATVGRELVKGLAAHIAGHLGKALSDSEELPAISAETIEGVRRRVPPKSVAECSSPENLPAVIALEIENLGDRIRLYPFVARYREVISSGPKEMSLAWQLHGHSLRQGELYIIQEQCVAALRFLFSVQLNFGDKVIYFTLSCADL